MTVAELGRLLGQCSLGLLAIAFTGGAIWLVWEETSARRSRCASIASIGYIAGEPTAGAARRVVDDLRWRRTLDSNTTTEGREE